MDGEATNAGTHSARRGSGDGMSEGWFGQRGRPVRTRIAASTIHWGRFERGSDRAIVPLMPGNAGEGKGPDFWYASGRADDWVIDRESSNAAQDPDASTGALPQSEDVSRIPVLHALRQDLSGRHP